MNIKQKQQAMIKLAQVRLAINHVLRKRAMAKQGSWLSKWWEGLWNRFSQPQPWQQDQSENFYNNLGGNQPNATNGFRPRAQSIQQQTTDPKLNKQPEDNYQGM